MLLYVFQPRWWIRVHLVNLCMVGVKELKGCLVGRSHTKHRLPFQETVVRKSLASWAESMLWPSHNQPSNPKTIREHYSYFLWWGWVYRNECLELVWNLLVSSSQWSKQGLPYTYNKLSIHPKTWRITLHSLLFYTSQTRCQQFVGSTSNFINPYPTTSHQFLLLPICFQPLSRFLWIIITF